MTTKDNFDFVKAEGERQTKSGLRNIRHSLDELGEAMAKTNRNLCVLIAVLGGLGLSSVGALLVAG